MTTTTSNIPEDVLQAIAARQAQAQQVASDDAVTLEKVQTALGERDWAALKEMFSRDHSLIVSYFNSDPVESAAQDARVDALHKDIMDAVRSAHGEGVTPELRMFLQAFIDEAGIYPDDVAIVLDPAWNQGDQEMYVGFMRLQEHGVDDYVNTIKTALASSPGTIRRRIVDESLGSITRYPLELRNEEKSARLQECTEAFIFSGSDYLMHEFLNKFEGMQGFTLTQDQFREMILRGLNGSVHQAVHAGHYVPSMDDLFFAVNHVDAVCDPSETFNSRGGKLGSYSSETIPAVSILKKMEPEFYLDQVREVLERLAQVMPAPRLETFTQEMAASLPAGQRTGMTELFLATKSDKVIATAVKSGNVELTHDVVAQLIEEGMNSSVYYASQQGFSMTDEQMVGVIRNDTMANGREWRVIAEVQVENGYIPGNPAIFESLVSANPTLLDKVVTNLANRGIDVSAFAPASPQVVRGGL